MRVSPGWFASLLALATLTFLPLLHTGFTTADDANTALLEPRQVLTIVKSAAQHQGRFQFLINWIVGYVPYAVHSDLYYEAFKVASLVAGAVVFLIVVNRLVRSFELTALAAVFYLAFLTNGWTHNLMTSYPVVFHVGISLLLLALWMFDRYITSGRGKDGIAAAVLYFAALLTYEAFLPALLLFVLLWLFRAERSVEIKGVRIPRPALLGAAMAPVASFLLLYVVFRALNPPDYEGVQVVGGTLRGFLEVLWDYSVAALPGYLPATLPPDVMRTAVVAGGSIATTLLTEARPEWIAKSLIVGCAVFTILRHGVGLRTGSLIRIASAGLLGVFLPNVLVALSPKYQAWVTTGSHGYAPTYFSFLSALLLVSASAFALCRVGPRPIASYVTPALLAFWAATTCAATAAFNHSITEDQHQSHAKWHAVDALLGSAEFKAVPERAIIYAPSLWQYRGIVGLPHEYWTRYFSQRAGRPIEVMEDLPDTKGADYYLNVEDEPASRECLLVFAAILKNTESRGLLEAKSIAILAPQAGLPLLVEGSLIGGPDATLLLDGRHVDYRDGRVFTARTAPLAPQPGLRVVRLESSAPIALRSLRAAFSFFQPESITLAVRPRQGFYAQESDGLGTTWNWSSGDGDMVIENTTRRPVDGELSFTVNTLLPRHVWLRLEDGPRTLVLSPPEKSRLSGIPVRIMPGVTRLRLETDVAAAPPNTSDPRKLAFTIHNIHVTPVSR